MKETWKEVIIKNQTLMVSNFGNVKKKKQGKEYILKKYINKGYEFISFKSRPYGVNRLVAHAFLGLDLKNTKKVVDHINNISTDNNVKNLQIVNHSFNTRKDAVNRIGVWYSDGLKKWIAKIYIKGNFVNLGLFDSKKDAELCYKIKLIQLKKNIKP